MGIIEIKNECEEVRKKAAKLYASKAADIILQDIRNYMKKYPDKVTQSNGTYRYEDKLVFHILDGNLDITDERGIRYGWLFEVESDLYPGDMAMVNGRWESVRYMRGEAMEDVAKEVVAKLKDKVKRLESEGIKEYTYYSDHENIRVQSIEEVFTIILKRKPR